MKTVYPVIFTKLREGGYMAYVPDMKINTQGENLAEAIEMARDAIGLMGIDMEDDHKKLPEPSKLNDIAKENEHDIITFVDVDFTEYRRQNDTRSVRRNVTLPGWLNFAAEKSGINVSAVLQAALKKELHIDNRP